MRSITTLWAGQQVPGGSRSETEVGAAAVPLTQRRLRLYLHGLRPSTGTVRNKLLLSPALQGKAVSGR